MRSFLRWLDLASWDSWVPLGLIGVFVVIAIPALTGDLTFGLPEGNLERLDLIYTDVGLQTTAGIFAIVISLSLVAIQFAAQEYSHRIMEYYTRSVIFWSTIVVYLGIMIATIVLQAGSEEPGNTRAGAVVVVASILAIVLLVPHFIVTAAYLKPEFIVSKLLRQVNDGFLRTVGTTVDSQRDRLLPVVEICERSIDRGDLTTTRAAISRIIDRHGAIPTELRGEVVDRYFIEHLTRIGRKAVAQPDEMEAAVHVIHGIEQVGGSGLPGTAIERIDTLGFMAIRHESEGAISQMIVSLERLATGDHRAAVLVSYQALVNRLVVGNYDRLLRELAASVDRVGVIAAAEGGAEDSARALDVLEAIGHDAASAGLIRVVVDVATRLKNGGVAAAQGDTDSARATVLRLLRIEQALDSSERDTLAAMAFTRGEVEAAVAKTGGGEIAVDDAGEFSGDDVAGQFSDLWDEDEA